MISVSVSGTSLTVKKDRSRRSSPARSPSSLSTLEPFLQAGVDTMEVCDKAAARQVISFIFSYFHIVGSFYTTYPGKSVVT